MGFLFFLKERGIYNGCLVEGFFNIVIDENSVFSDKILDGDISSS